MPLKIADRPKYALNMHPAFGGSSMNNGFCLLVQSNQKDNVAWPCNQLKMTLLIMGIETCDTSINFTDVQIFTPL